MKRYCEVCKKKTEFYNAFGTKDISIVCRICGCPKDRKKVNKKCK